MSGIAVRNLRIGLGGSNVVDGVSFDVAPGECVAIVGESGAGKTLTAHALLGFAPGVVDAEVLRIDGTDARSFRERQWRTMRGAKIALVSQDALGALDPLRRVGAEIAEPLEIHRIAKRRDRSQRVQSLLRSVAMPEARRRARQYPHELSGGLRQRALIASALAAGPAILIADEPTTALDATVQVRVLELLRAIADRGTAMLFISHDFSAVRRIADRVLVMRAGRIVEQGPVDDVLHNPADPYTAELIAATSPAPAPPRPATPVLLAAAGLSRSFDGHFAVRDADFTLHRGRTLGIVGESGSGKTTLARMIVGVETPQTGTMHWLDDPGRVQLVHQDPLAAFDPRWRIGRSLSEALATADVPRERRQARAAALLQEVGLETGLLSRRPRQVSGGQRQRLAIARALAADPRVLVLDEPVSALDPSVRVRILELLARVQAAHGLTMVVISHDLAVIASIADEVLVMQEGRVVEQGPTGQVLTHPAHPFTRELVAAAAV